MRTALLCLLLSAMSLFSLAQKGQSYHIRNTNNGETQIKIRDNKTDIELVYSGKILLTEDETAVEKMEEESYMRLRSGEQKLAIRYANGGIRYKLNDQAESSELNAEGKKLFADLLQLAIDNGFNADQRAERLYKRGGASLVITEARKKQSDYIKQIYFSSLLQNQLSNDDLNKTIAAVMTDVSSDYYKASLLKKMIQKEKLSSAALGVFLDAAKTIDSDYEKASVLKEALKQSSSDEHADKILAVTSGVSSDYYRASLLKTAIQQNASIVESPKFLSALKQIHSDYEKSSVLKLYLKNKNEESLPYTEIVTALNTIDSDYEKAGILKSLTSKPVKTDKDWLMIISATEQLHSNHEKANVLSNIAANISSNDEVQKAFAKAAKTISSDHDYGRVMRKLNKQ
jgi:hypothetical protein